MAPFLSVLKRKFIVCSLVARVKPKLALVFYREIKSLRPITR